MMGRGLARNPRVLVCLIITKLATFYGMRVYNRVVHHESIVLSLRPHCPDIMVLCVILFNCFLLFDKQYLFFYEGF